VLMKVRIDSRDDELRFSALEVELLKFDRGVGELRLTLRPEDLTSTSIGALREIIRATRASHRSSSKPVRTERSSG